MTRTHATRLSLLIAAPTATLGGFLIRLAFPGPALWWLAPFGVIAVLLALWQQRGRHGLWLGLLAGAAWWLPLIDWLTLYLGPVPWAALAGAMIFWSALMGVCVSVTTTWIAKAVTGAATRVLAQSVAVAGIWIAKEGVQSTFPYGGFPWGRIAHTQAEGPLVQLVSYTGFAGLTGIIVLACAAPVATVMHRKQVRPTGLAAVGVLAVLSVCALIPAYALPVTGTMHVAAVQGNSKSGVFDDRDSGDVIADHVRVTEQLLAETDDTFDAIVWPENSAEFGLFDRRQHLRSVRELSRQAKAPLVVGSVLEDRTEGASTFTNSSLVIDAQHDAVQRYDKRHPVPFAEYMPHRAFYRALAPDLVDMVQLEYEHGTTPAALTVNGIMAGIAICFDIIFDDMAGAMADDGAEIIFAQTNNADFGYTDQSEQQTFIAKLRAVEMGRSLVNISTVATSEMILPTGETIAQVPQWEPGWMSAELPLVQGRTPALRFGTLIAGVWITVSAMIAVWARARIRSTR